MLFKKNWAHLHTVTIPYFTSYDFAVCILIFFEKFPWTCAVVLSDSSPNFQFLRLYCIEYYYERN